MYDPLSGNYFPADLEKTNAASASAAASTSKDSYTKTIKMSLVKGLYMAALGFIVCL
jgi:hypothetical protein